MNHEASAYNSRTDDDWVDPVALRDALYSIQSGDAGPIKIGRGFDVQERLRKLQTGSHEDLYVLASYDREGWQEPVWHRAFAKYRIRGEWFDPAPPC